MAWSFSRLAAYNTCPRQYAEIKLFKNYQEVPHPTTEWGTRGHLALEERVRDGAELPSEFSYLEGFAKKVVGLPGQTFCELELACTKEKTPTAFDAPDAWARGIIDVFKFRDTSAVALDYKFGKVKPTGQLKLMALLAFANFPMLQEVKTRFLWIQFRDASDGVFYRKDMARLWQEFEDGAQQLEQAAEEGIYPPKPSGLCRPNGKGYYGCVVTSCEFCGKGGRR